MHQVIDIASAAKRHRNNGQVDLGRYLISSSIGLAALGLLFWIAS